MLNPSGGLVGRAWEFFPFKLLRHSIVSTGRLLEHTFMIKVHILLILHLGELGECREGALAHEG